MTYPVADIILSHMVLVLPDGNVCSSNLFDVSKGRVDL